METCGIVSKELTSHSQIRLFLSTLPSYTFVAIPTKTQLLIALGFSHRNFVSNFIIIISAFFWQSLPHLSQAAESKLKTA